MKKILFALSVAVCSCMFSADAYYNNVNNSYDYDRGYNVGYSHGQEARVRPPQTMNIEYNRGYMDGAKDGAMERRASRARGNSYY